MGDDGRSGDCGGGWSVGQEEFLPRTTRTGETYKTQSETQNFTEI